MPQLINRTRAVKFQFPNELVLEWKSSSAYLWVFISYLKERMLASKGCVYYLVLVNDCSAQIPHIQLVLVVKEFPEVSPNDLPGVPPEGEIDFSIDLFLDNRPISIPPHKLPPA